MKNIYDVVSKVSGQSLIPEVTTVRQVARSLKADLKSRGVMDAVIEMYPVNILNSKVIR